MVKVPLSYSFLERRDARRKFSESLGAGASLAPRTRQRISLGSENDWKFRLRSCQNWKASSLSLEGVVPTSINKDRMRYVGLGRGNLRSHFVFRPRHAPEWLRARFLPVAFLANEEELTGKTFTTSLNTTNPITYVKFIFLRTSPLTAVDFKQMTRTWEVLFLIEPPSRIDWHRFPKFHLKRDPLLTHSSSFTNTLCPLDTHRRLVKWPHSPLSSYGPCTQKSQSMHW